METLSNILYWLSSGLFVPVMLGTVIMFFYALYMSGVFYGSYKEYAKYNRYYRSMLLEPAYNALLPALNNKEKKKAIEIHPFIIHILKNRKSRTKMENILSDYELDADKKLGKYKMLAKLGPILGLMGTLIPMGPALAGLGQGDVSSMSWNMQVAFATTVIGLFSGTVGFLLLQPRQRMLIRYLSDMEVLVNHIAEIESNDCEAHTLEQLVNENIQ